MKTLIISLLIFVSADLLQAVPRFAVTEDVNCASCHSFQGGGAGRTSYGKDYARESLVMKDVVYPWVNEDSEFPLYFGVDTRYQFVGNENEDLRHFPMQLAAYVAGEFGNLIPHLEVNRILDEYRVTGGLRYEGLPLESSFSIGRELPAFGWRIDDHTLFTRGGNLVNQGLEREGMPFTPFILPPEMVELTGMPLEGLNVSLMAGTAFLSQQSLDDASQFAAVKLNYSYSGDILSAQSGLAYLKEGDLTTSVATWSILAKGFVWLGEVSQIANWPRADQTNYALLHQLSYRLIQGLDIIGRYEFFDQDTNWQTGSIQRTTLGLEIFPIPGIELKLNYRVGQLGLPGEASSSKGQFLGQIHFYL